jgi:multiple sugar transport system permease protein
MGTLLLIGIWVVVVLNLGALAALLFGDRSRMPMLRHLPKFFAYEILGFGTLIMAIPFYWMLVTAFKDGRTATQIPPVWTPSRVQTFAPDPENPGSVVAVLPLDIQRQRGQEVRVVPEDQMEFRPVDAGGFTVVRETPIEGARIFTVDPTLFESKTVLSLDGKNFRRAWHRPEESTRGQVNFLTYFIVSIVTSALATGGTLFTSALAAFAFARLRFWGKDVLFYLVLATMMVPGQVLLIPNFLILSSMGLLDTYAALVVPWLASVFTIFLMRQFFMTIPEDLWDAARIDGASRFRYLWQIVVPLSVPVFITAGIFDFLNNWNSLLWPLIVTSTPSKRTLMVGLQNLADEAGQDYQIMMAASALTIMPVVIAFFFLQRFFIEGIARTGLK